METISFVTKHVHVMKGIIASHQAWKILLADHHAIKHAAEQLLSDGTSWWEWWELTSQIIRKAYRRRVFATDTRFLGLGPDSNKDGDTVAVLFSQLTPLVLRPTGSGSYTLLGDAYVEGIMHGAIMKTSPTITTLSIVWTSTQNGALYTSLNRYTS